MRLSNGHLYSGGGLPLRLRLPYRLRHSLHHCIINVRHAHFHNEAYHITYADVKAHQDQQDL